MSHSIKFQNLSKPVQFSEKQKTYIKSLGELKGDEWEKNDKIMLSIKEDILKHMEQEQGYYCIYCGWHKDKVARSGFEREHIACKNGRGIKYPQFMFEPYNLVLACHDCNKLKLDKNTISTLSSDYTKCVFTIIHPFFDKFEDNIIFMNKNNSDSIGIVLIPITEKGYNTIQMFKLNEFYQIEDRGKCMKREDYDILPAHEIILNNILSENRNSI